MLADVPDDEVVPRGIVPQLVRGFPALRHAYFRRYMLGQSISLVGFWMQAVAQSWLVFRLSASPFALGAVASAAFLPVAFVSPFAGVLADRVNRHRLIMVTQSAAMILAVTLGVLVATERATVPLVGLLAFTLGVVGAVDLPTRQAFLVELVGPRDLSSAIALNASVFNAARVVGPAIAGGLVATVGEAPCFFLNGASYLAVLIALATMRFPRAVDRPVRASPRAALGEGFRYVRAHRVLASMLIALGLVSGLSIQFNVLLPVVSERIFGRGASGYGMLLTAFGIGAVVSALRLASRRFTAVEHRRHLLVGLAVFGGGLLGVAASPRIEIAMACNLIAGLGMINFTATTNALLQLLVADDHRGRVMGLHTVMFMGTSPIGSLLIGGLAQRFGPILALVVSATVPLVVALWLAKRIPLRALERRV